MNKEKDINEEKKVLKKLSLDEFINKGLEKETNRKKEVDINIEGLGPVTFTKPTEDEMLEFLNAQANSFKINKNEEIIGSDLISLTAASKGFIYFHCPFLQNTQLHEAWGIKDPLDTPARAFGIENLPDIAGRIKDAFEDPTVKTKIKN
jgi:hypothetical protein